MNWASLMIMLDVVHQGSYDTGCVHVDVLQRMVNYGHVYSAQGTELGYKICFPEGEELYSRTMGDSDNKPWVNRVVVRLRNGTAECLSCVSLSCGHVRPMHYP